MATELGQAYVQIMPSAKGISGSIRNQLDPEASSAGHSAGNKISSGLKVALVAATAAIGVSVGKIISDSISEGAKLQQSLGGIETLFKDSAGMVKKYADEAYRTVGLSANEYMENVTGFSASLLQSMGGDTKKAGKIANMAMIDMGDNANKMGTNMGDIQNAYQGFAKQNYTMLDNLKLGYGGTKTEMERLLKDATKLTGVKYNLDNLGDVYSAIHAIQEELDITGTTAKEANETFSGSFAAMASAYKNVMGKLSINEDVSADLKALAQTISTFLFKNFFPMVGNVLKALPGAIKTFAKEAGPLFLQAGKEFISNLRKGMSTGKLSFMLPILDAIINAVSTFGTIISDVITNYVVPTLQKLTTWISENQDIVNKFGKALSSLVVGFVAFKVISTIVPIITTVITSVKGLVTAFSMIKSVAGILALVKLGFTTLVAAVGGPVVLITAAIAGLIAIFVALYKNNEEFRNKVQEIWASIQAFFSAALTFISGIVKTVMREVTTFFGSQLAKIREFWNENGKGIMDIVKLIMSNIMAIIKGAMGIIQGIFQIVWPIISGVVQIAWAMIKSAVKNGIDLVLGIIKTVMKLIQGDWKGAWEAIKETGQNIMNNIVDFFSSIDLVQIGKDIIQGLINGISSMTGAVKKMVSKLAGNIPGWAKDILGIASPSKVFAQIGEWTGEGLVQGMDSTARQIKSASERMAEMSVPNVPTTDVGGVNSSGSYGNAQSLNLEGLFKGAVFNVREEQDIEKIAKALNDYIKLGARKGGVIIT